MATTTLLLLGLTLFYGIIILIYTRVNREFKGGRLAQLSKIIIFAIFFIALSDLAVLLKGVFSEEAVLSVKLLMRLSSLTVLAFGGMRLMSG
jgi:hypothetical protein